MILSSGSCKTKQNTGKGVVWVMAVYEDTWNSRKHYAAVTGLQACTSCGQALGCWFWLRSDHWGSSRIPKSQSSCLLSRPGCKTCRKQECSLPLPFKFLLLLDLCWVCGVTVPENLNTECRAPDKESEAVGEGHSLNCLITNPFLQLFFIQSSNETEPMAPS